MEDELKVLEEKVGRMLAMSRTLLTENTALKAQLQAAQNESKQLREQMHQASERLDALLQQLPQDHEA